MSKMILETERLFLREMNEHDYDALYLVFSDSDIMRHYPYSFDEKRIRGWIGRNLSRYRENGFGLWAVCLKDSGELIGDCGLTLQSIGKEVLPEIGYHIRRDCQRMGYAKEAAKAVLNWAFQNTDYPAMYSYCKYTNKASIRTAESIGMHFDRECPDSQNGITHVSVIRRDDLIQNTGKAGEGTMSKRALVIIDLQNDITKHYREIIEKLNDAVDWAAGNNMEVVYIRHNNLSAGTRTFKPGTRGAELVPKLKVVSENIFIKTKASALTSEAFSEFIRENGIDEFYVAGADATACVKSTCFNMVKGGFTVHVISDCVTSYDPKKIGEMLDYYEKKGCEVRTLSEYQDILAADV